MRPQDTFAQKTNITSLATIAVVMAFVVWMTSFAARPDSIIARAPQASAAGAALNATPHRVAAQRPDEGEPASGRG
jgi:hypothetical protein